jgi:hypothetical protein
LADAVIRDFDPGTDTAALEDLWMRVFGTPRGGQSLAWLFRPGPAGDSPRSVAEQDGRIVAHAGAMAMRFQCGGETIVRGGYSVAAMTDPACRGQRLFFRVGEHLYRRMTEHGFAFVAGFSNANSFRLMTGPLQRTAIRPFPWCVRPLSPFALARGVLGRAGAPATADADAVVRALRAAERGDVALAVLDPAAGDARLDAIWSRVAPGVGVGAVRDAAFVRWRYATRPDAGYRLVVASRAGRAAGWFAHRSLALRGIPAGFVVDFVLAPDEAEAGATLLRAAAGLARAEGAALLSALRPGSGPARRALGRAGFVPVPEALHPQVIRFSVRGLGAHAQRTDWLQPRAWTLGWSDTDVV